MNGQLVLYRRTVDSFLHNRLYFVCSKFDDVDLIYDWKTGIIDVARDTNKYEIEISKSNYLHLKLSSFMAIFTNLCTLKNKPIN